MDITHIAMVLAALAIAVLVYWSMVPNRHRPLYLLGLSIVAAGILSAAGTLYFLCNIALVYFAAIQMSKGNAGRRGLLVLVLVWLIGNLCFFKYGSVLLAGIFAAGVRLSLLRDAPSFTILLPLGMSYVVLRLIHYLIEAYRNNVPRSSFADFALYVIFFPTFLAGPVDRFQRFYPQTQATRKLDATDINNGLFRIAVGMVRKFAVADVLGSLITPVLQNPSEHARLWVVLSAYGWIVRIYMDFAGYTDMAIGVGRLFGYTIMENFNKPLLQRNIALFWRHWHISVYTWIRDYFFFPLFAHRASNAKIYAGIFCSITLFMIWHEATVGYLVAGLYHTVGLATWYVFDNAIKSHPRLRRLTAHRFLDYMAIFVTFTFVSFGALIYSFGLRGTGRIVSHLVTPGG